jgi:HEAT repeat protein
MTGLSVDGIIRLIEEKGREGRTYLETTDFPEKMSRLCAALERATSPRVRHVICNLMATLGDPAALPCLLARLSDQDPSVVAAAADAIGNSSYDQEVAEPLRMSLGHRLLELVADRDHGDVIRPSAIYALGLMRFREAVPSLLEAIDSESPRVRWSAAEALAHIGDAAAEPVLERRYRQEDDARVKRYIATALQMLRS